MRCQSPEWDGAHCDASAIPAYRHTPAEVLRHPRNQEMPELRGRRLAGAPTIGNEISVFRVIERLVDGTESPKLYPWSGYRYGSQVSASFLPGDRHFRMFLKYIQCRIRWMMIRAENARLQ